MRLEQPNSSFDLQPIIHHKQNPFDDQLASAGEGISMVLCHEITCPDIKVERSFLNLKAIAHVSFRQTN